MSVDLKITVDLTPKQVETAIKYWLSGTENLALQGNVTFDIGLQSQGYGLDEHDVMAFRGASCIVKKSNSAYNGD